MFSQSKSSQLNELFDDYAESKMFSNQIVFAINFRKRPERTFFNQNGDFHCFRSQRFSCNQIRKCPKPTTFWILNFIIERSVPMKSISFQWKRAAWESDGIASGARNLIKPIENYGSLTFQQYETKLKSQEH